MNQLLSFLKLEPLKGSRTQIVIVIYGAINFLASIGILHLNAEDLRHVNEFLTWAGSYFLADKLTTTVAK